MTDRSRFFSIAAFVLVALFGAQAMAYVDVRDEPTTDMSADPTPDDVEPAASPTEDDVAVAPTPEETEADEAVDADASPTPAAVASPTPATEDDADDRVASTGSGGLPMTGSPLLPWTALGGLLITSGLTALAPRRRPRPKRFWLELDELS